MGDATREYQAIVWIKGSATQPERLTVQACDEAEAQELIVERFGEQIVSYSVWNEEELSETWARPKADNRIKEYMAIVWTKDPSVAGRRMTVEARNIDDAKKLAKEQFGEEADFCYVWNEEEQNRPR